MSIHDSSDLGDVRFYDYYDFAQSGHNLFLRKDAAHGTERSLEYNVRVVVTTHQTVAEMSDQLFIAVPSTDANTEYISVIRSRS